MSALSPTAVKPLSAVHKELRPANLRLGSRFTGMRVHFVGIGGSGMNGLARMLLDCGAIVTGSDAKPNAQTLELTKRGVRISRDQHGELLDKTVDLVVRTAAVKDDQPEIAAAHALGLRVIKYAKLLGEVMEERLGVAVAGTHGKSTTTAMTALALVECGLDPSFVVGGTVPQLGGTGSRSGQGNAFVAEACEYDRSFHNLAPTLAVITNIEEDHLDCYSGIYQIIESFRQFVKLLPSHGKIIANGRDGHVAKVIRDAAVPVETVSLGHDTVWSTRPTGLKNGCPTGEVRFNGDVVATLELSVPGEHNLLNATMALAAAVNCGADVKAAAAAIGKFIGVDRRQTEIGRFNGDIVVDDYAHHPTELRTTLRALREKYSPKRLVCIFQPHQHSRTRHLIEDFATSFVDADLVVMPNIYFVRDSEAEKRTAVRTQDLIEKNLRKRAIGDSHSRLPRLSWHTSAFWPAKGTSS
ncbi:MAG: UDP-N-acetylmuramate--L-alanine ligase [Tepidisphaeraceae bacterium]